MANIIELLFKAKDEATGTISKVAGGMKDLTKQVGEINSLAKAQALQTLGRDVQQYFSLGQRAVSDLTNEFMNYAEQVRTLSRLTGASSEESSRAIQIADDLKISYQSLSIALEAGVRKGIDPSIDSLAALSDEYLKLEPGLQRSAFLMEKFGRSGMDLAPMLELGSEEIRKMNDEIDRSLVLTAEQTKKAREAEIALDAYNDKVLALRLSIGSEVWKFGKLTGGSPK